MPKHLMLRFIKAKLIKRYGIYRSLSAEHSWNQTINISNKKALLLELYLILIFSLATQIDGNVPGLLRKFHVEIHINHSWFLNWIPVVRQHSRQPTSCHVRKALLTWIWYRFFLHSQCPRYRRCVWLLYRANLRTSPWLQRGLWDNFRMYIKKEIASNCNATSNIPLYGFIIVAKAIGRHTAYSCHFDIWQTSFQYGAEPHTKFRSGKKFHQNPISRLLRNIKLIYLIRSHYRSGHGLCKSPTTMMHCKVLSHWLSLGWSLDTEIFPSRIIWRACRIMDITLSIMLSTSSNQVIYTENIF